MVRGRGTRREVGSGTAWEGVVPVDGGEEYGRLGSIEQGLGGGVVDALWLQVELRHMWGRRGLGHLDWLMMVARCGVL